MRACWHGCKQLNRAALSSCVIASVAFSQSTLRVSRGRWRSRLFGAGGQAKERLRRMEFCHREERGDLDCSGLANNQKRDCFVGNSVIARYVAILVVRRWQTGKREIASQGILSSRGTKRSRLSRAGKQPKERLRRREFCHREERGDLGCSGLANNQKRDCRASLAMTRLFVLG